MRKTKIRISLIPITLILQFTLSAKEPSWEIRFHLGDLKIQKNHSLIDIQKNSTSSNSGAVSEFQKKSKEIEMMNIGMDAFFSNNDIKEKAIESIVANPEEPIANYIIGRSLYQSGDIKLSLYYITMAAESDQSNVLFQLEAAKIFQQSGRRRESAKYLKRVSEIEKWNRVRYAKNQIYFSKLKNLSLPFSSERIPMD